jgi:hypothetical protein
MIQCFDFLFSSHIVKESKKAARQANRSADRRVNKTVDGQSSRFLFKAFPVIIVKNLVIIMLLCTVFIVNTYDNFQSYTSIRVAKTSDFSKAYYLGPTESHYELAFCKEGQHFSYDVVEALISVNDYMKSLDGSIIVFMPGDFASYSDIYLDPKAFPVTPSQFYDLAVSNGGWVRMDAQPLAEGNRFQLLILEIDTWKRGVLSADYIVTIADEHPFANVEVEFESWPFAILKNFYLCG